MTQELEQKIETIKGFLNEMLMGEGKTAQVVVSSEIDLFFYERWEVPREELNKQKDKVQLMHSILEMTNKFKENE